jgi:DNA-binding transcriptional ArsR family regulator
VREEDLESFAATYRPQRAGRRAGQTTRNDLHRTAIAELLADWQNATAEELATAIGLHPGNVRKHLAMLRAAGIVDRDDDGLWQLTPSGQRYQEARAKSA